MIKKIAYFAGFTFLLATLLFAAEGRKIAQLAVDQATAWEVFTDVGVTATVVELNLTNQGTDAVSDTFYHTRYVTCPIDFAVQNKIVGRVAFAKPNDMTVKVLGATIAIDSQAVLTTADGHDMFLYVWRYNSPADTASGAPLDSLLTGNKIQLDSTGASAASGAVYVANFSDLTIKAASATIADSGGLELWLETSDNAIITQAFGAITFELYVKPE